MKAAFVSWILAAGLLAITVLIAIDPYGVVSLFS